MGWPEGIEPSSAGPQPAVLTVAPWPPCRLILQETPKKSR